MIYQSGQPGLVVTQDAELPILDANLATPKGKKKYVRNDRATVIIDIYVIFLFGTNVFTDDWTDARALMPIQLKESAPFQRRPNGTRNRIWSSKPRCVPDVVGAFVYLFCNRTN